MSKKKYYDFVICQISSSIDLHKKWIKELDSLKLNYMFISVNTKFEDKVFENNFREDYINLKVNKRIEFKAMEYAYKNYTSRHYFIIGSNDIPDDFKVIYSLIKRWPERMDFFLLRERKEGYYSRNFKKIILDTHFSPGSCYAYYSSSLLKAILFNGEKTKKYSNDLIWESIIICENNKDTVNSMVGKYVGSISKVPSYKIKNLETTILLNSNIVSSFITSLPFLVLTLYNFNHILLMVYIIIFTILNIFYYLLKRIKKG